MKILSKKLFATNKPTKYAIVDDDIAETIQKMGLKFCVQPNGYWYSTTEIQLTGMIKKMHLLLHRFVFTLKTGEEPVRTVDHIDRNRANNMFENLRLATRQEQQQNQGKRKDNTSGYIGVIHHHQIDNRHKKPWFKDYWRTSVRRHDGRQELKLFPYTEAGKLAAARWYDKKAKEYYGDFVGELNFPDKD